MPDLKLLRIEEGDSQKNFVDKVNYNFSGILSFGGGPYGRIGHKGPQGDQGQKGPTGSYGDMGLRGTSWTVGPTQPSIGVISGDLWIDTLSYNKVYQYSGTTWNYYNVNISAQDLFRVFGPIGTSNKSGYYITSTTPENYNLVLSDKRFDNTASPSVYNPEYSKVVVATDSTVSSRKILEFTKSDYSGTSSFYSKTPRFYWNSGATASRGNYGLIFSSSDGFFMDMPGSKLGFYTGATASFNSTGFNLNLNLNPMSVSVGGDLIIDLTPNGIASFSSGNIGYSGNQFSLPIRTYFYSSGSDSNPPIWVKTTVPGASNFRHFSNVPSNRSSYLLNATDTTNNLNVLSVYGNGDVLYNKRIDSIQSSRSISNTTTGSVNGTNVYWVPIVPSVGISGPVSTNSLACSNGVDFVFDPTNYNGDGSHNIGICLWTPAQPGGTGANQGWLNLLDDHECLTITVRTAKSNQYFRYLGLNTTGDQNYLPVGVTSSDNEGNGQFVDLSGVQSAGASSVDFTIMNITGTGASGSSYRWFKVYYSAYGGNLGGGAPGFEDYTRCGVLYTYNSTPY